MGAAPSWPHLNLITFQKPHLKIPSHWGLELQYINLVGEGHKQSVRSKVKSKRLA